MHDLFLVLLIVLLVWFLFPAQKIFLSNEEMYRGEPSRIQIDNAEFKFYT